jgi:putative membrane protein
MTFVGALLGLVIAFLISAVIIWVVSRLGLGLEVDTFGGAVVAAIVIALVTWIVLFLLGLVGITVGGAGLWAAIVSLVVSAVILMISDKFVSGMRVKGFLGAIIAAIAISVGHFLLVWLANLLNITLLS